MREHHQTDSPGDIQQRHRNLMAQNFRKYSLLNIVCLLGGSVHAGFIYLFAQLEVPVLALYNVPSVALWLIAAYLNYRGRIDTAIWLICAEITAFCTLADALLGPEAGFDFYLWSAAVLMVINPGLAVRWSAAAGFGFIILYVALNRVFADAGANYPLSSEWVDLLWGVNAVIAMVPITLSVWSVRSIYERQHQEFERLAHFDPLTGIRNRRYGQQSVTGRRRPSAGQTTDCLCLADIDYFKRINDQFGHDAGDRVLQAVASYLNQALRTGDFVCRWGGEEFLLVLRGSRLQDAELRLRAICEQMPAQVKVDDLDNLSVTMSFGLVEQAPDESGEQAISRADVLLYQAKRDGRNQVVAA